MISLCNMICDVERSTVTAGASGGQVRTWAPVLQGEACAIQPRSMRTNQDFHGKISEDVDTVIYFPRIVDVRANDRIVSGGVVYNVLASGDMAGRALYTKVMAKRVDQ